MSKNRGGGGDGGFSNKAARFFNQDKIKKIQRASEPEIMEMLNDDFEIITKQLTDFANHERGAKFPKYLTFIFQNLSSARFLRRKIEVIRKDLSSDQKAGLRILLETGYRETVVNSGNLIKEESSDRIRLLMKAYTFLYPKRVRKIRKELGVSEIEAAELAMFTQGEPYHNIRTAAAIFDASDVKTSKKFRLLKKLTEDDEMWLGAFLTVAKPSDMVTSVYDLYKKSGRKKQYRILGHYAICFKYNSSTSPFLNSKFFEDKANVRHIKKLCKEDIGFKKAFFTYFKLKVKAKRKAKELKELNESATLKLGSY